MTIVEAQDLLARLGLPKAQQNEISALTLLALANLGPANSWQNAQSTVERIHDMMTVMKEKWNRPYAENTREVVRRQVIHQLEQARIVDRNPENPNLPTNSPKTHYALSIEALECVRAYGTSGFEAALADFAAKYGQLVAKYRKARASSEVSVELSQGVKIALSPGKHNELQRDVIEKFVPTFAPEAVVVYLGDTAKKSLYVNDEAVTELGLTVSDHEKLPDIILWDRDRKWLFLIEVVTTHGPVSPKREKELRAIFGQTSCNLIFVTAFQDMKQFKRHAQETAWETEVWLADEPSHMIHFNGEKFLGPR